MRTNIEQSHIYNPRISGIRHFNVVTRLVGTQIIPDDGPTVWVLDGGTSDRTVRLPQLSYEREIVLANAGTTNSFNVTDSAGNALVTLGAQAMGVFYASSSRWVWLAAAFTVAGAIGKTVVTGSTTIATSDLIVQVNSVGAAVLALPSSTGWNAASGSLGLPLSIMDISGGADSNNITINPDGSDTISGLASYTINTAYGAVRLMPKAGGGGWVVS